MQEPRFSNMAKRVRQGATLAAALAVGAAIAGPAQAQTKLLMGYYSSSTAANAAEGFIPWLESVEEMSEGRIETEFVGGGAIVKTSTSLFALRDGMVDLTNVYTPANPKELPVATLLGDLSALMNNDKAAAGALAQLQHFECPDCVAEYDSWNTKLISSWATPPYQLLCATPIESADDFAGKRIRTTGHLTGIATGLGATPVNISLTEVYESLQRGLVDCTFGQFVWLDDYSLAEQAKFLLTPNAGVVPAQLWVGINKDTWNKLSEEDRQILFDATPAAVARVTFNYDSGAKEAIASAVENGAIYNEPQDWLTEAVAAATTTVRDDAVARAEGSGVANAAAIADRFLEIYAEWEEKVKDIETQEEFAQLLADEVYSKVDVSQ
ncbi:C4-dicarboxylate TRAP transporter substrate-binding protein [Maritimibacter fusiformis]|uniref:TRAP-type C4-dicarboxylate transport system substrate-binding protein n=1 Tax=Maritimibacter fusiformis TaxID=2603819 RepID=A0A5D0RP11_9RHOB|nr:C4-dicarboxylate TRAP transporter substrate-binding protein [Maritimibacter fusiformis]TYB82314.1 hypothetical protein FVF75_06230 [Maritimibacter fusiformis]